MKTPLTLSLYAGCTLLGICLGTASAFPDEVAPPASAHDPGVWKRHKYSFAFMGFTTTYSCDGLADKLQLLLLASGARADATARSGACANGFGRPDKFARADLTFYTLSPTKVVAASGGPVIEGTWRPVSFASRKPLELGTGDCELVEQFKNNVLPMFETRSLESRTTCIPNQNSGSVIDLKFESFSVVPQKPGNKAPPPEADPPR